MKVVICAQHGGFGLSMDGERAYLARKGKQAFFYANARDGSGHVTFDKYVRAEAIDHPFVVFTLTKDMGDNPSEKQVNQDGVWFSGRDIPRDDPDLVAVVEELGDKASGRHATLRIVEVPDGVEWEIDEYDGLEWVAEKHRRWS